MIAFDRVDFSYRRGHPVLSGFSFTVPDDGRVWLCGPSGCGKTTVLRLLMGLEKPKNGTVTVNTEGGISAVFQEDRLIASKTVLENVALFSDSVAAQKMLKELGLSDCLSLLPSELSGGMKRRVALARALAHPFSLLVLDEPFTGLDGEAAELCISAVNRAVKGKTLIIATHHKVEAEALFADTVFLSAPLQAAQIKK